VLSVLLRTFYINLINDHKKLVLSLILVLLLLKKSIDLFNTHYDNSEYDFYNFVTEVLGWVVEFKK